jgi:hypothetical protein
MKENEKNQNHLLSPEAKLIFFASQVSIEETQSNDFVNNLLIQDESIDFSSPQVSQVH